MELEELNLEGFVKVLEIADCPPIAEGAGRVVTMTVNHDNHFVYHLTFGPRGPPLKVTGYHPLYSETRGDCVKVKYLKKGEVLRTFDGTKTIVKKERVPGRFKVFNLEVEADHQYFAWEYRIFSHNTHKCTMTSRDSEGNVVHTDELESGGTGVSDPNWTEQLNSHTEAKGRDLTEAGLKDGEGIASVEFDGVKEPCNGCKNKMQTLKDDTGVDVKYNWTEELKTMFSTYSQNPNGTYSWQAK